MRKAPVALSAAGFTLVELMAVAGIVAALVAIAIPSYSEYLERTRRLVAINDIKRLMVAIDRWREELGQFPQSLGQLEGGSAPRDPWGRPYEYLAIDTKPAPNKGALRKDKNLVPLNSDYDLYSVGRDGLSQKPLTAKHSRDDIVRAGNGDFVGVATDH